MFICDLFYKFKVPFWSSTVAFTGLAYNFTSGIKELYPKPIPPPSQTLSR